jgi:ubiquinone/menaquinone biosynthesis C-methylase UbiE
MNAWRSGIRKLVRKFRVVFPLLLAVMVVALATSLAQHRPALLSGTLAAAGILLAGVTGYVARMDALWPRLHEYRRTQYAEVWDELAAQPMAAAAAAAAGISSEPQLEESGNEVVRRVQQRVPLTREIDAVEIACGVARIGRQLAPHCRTWTGCDISANMLSHARSRLSGLQNISLVRLSGNGLVELPADSADLVYCTNALPHFDAMERWRYVRESFRVLRRGGWLYFDTVALDSPEGWFMMANNLGQRANNVDPPYMPIPSTPDEFTAYLRNAGFQHVRADVEGSLLIVTATKS